MILSVKSYAKLNLFLKVYDKRPDGFHDIISIMQSIDLADTLTFDDAADGNSGIRITCNDPEIPTDESNLVWKAAEILANSINLTNYGLKIHIVKNIPPMGGLAGGSSNAAATLIALRQIWCPEKPSELLFKLAAEIGSDIPFCLQGGTVLVRGKGEILEPLPEGLDRKFPEGVFLLVLPPVKVETGPAYDAIDSGRETDVRKWDSLWDEHLTVLEGWLNGIGYGDFTYLFHNDFENPVFNYHPELEAIHENLRNHAGHALMSGSGSTIFAWFPSMNDAFAARDSYSPVAGESVLLARPVGQGMRPGEG